MTSAASPHFHRVKEGWQEGEEEDEKEEEEQQEEEEKEGVWCMMSNCQTCGCGQCFLYSFIEGQHNTNLQYMFCEGHKS